MTVLVGLECSGGAWVGSDSFFGSDSWLDVLDRPKHVVRGPLLIASAGELRPGQLAELIGGFRTKRNNESDVDYLARAVAEPIRKAHKKADASNANAAYLLAYNGRVYTMFGDYGVYRSSFGYAAVGAGDRYALGSLASAGTKDPKARVETAMRATAKHCPCVCGPFHLTFVPALRKQ